MNDTPTQSIAWPSPPASPSGIAPGHQRLMAPDLANHAAHIWAMSLDLSPELLDPLEATLCPEERQRAQRFRFDQHRSRFVAGRGLLRAILGRYLNVKPAAVEFSYGPHGKPALNYFPRGSRLEFNLAHSEGLALLALTTMGPVGVDLERVRSLSDIEELVKRFFSKAEANAFHALPSALRPAAFFRLWTRKEAWLKATGEGITQSLHRVEVSFQPEEAARLVRLPPGLGHLDDWWMADLAPGPGFAAAVALRAKDATLQCWRWEAEDNNQIFAGVAK